MTIPDMKYLIFCLTLLLAACEEHQDIDPENADDPELYLEKWKLVQMSGSFAGTPPTTGGDMDWQETYTLFADNAFTKIRKQNGDTNEVNGTYEYITLSDGEYLELTYSSESKLIGNCTGEPKELLMVESEIRLIGTWWACDGPGLVYKKVSGQDGSVQ